MSDPAPYMRWSKDHAPARWDLSGSNLLACSIDDLPGACEALELTGLNADGWPPLLEAIADRYGVSADRVATGSGAGGANFLALATLVRSGDDVLVERPAYDPLLGALDFLGARVRRFDRTFESGWALEPDRIADAISTDTRLVVLTNPHNPTGVLTPPADIDSIAAAASSVGAHLLIDEVYLDIASGPGPVRPAAARSDASITTSSLTKSYGLNGLRAGWILAPPDVIRRVRRMRDIMDGIGPVPVDRLATLAFRHLDALAERARRIVDHNRAVVDDFLNRHPQLEYVPPASTLVFPRIRGVSDCGPFLERLREERDTQLGPGRFFDAPAHFRIAFAGDRAILEGALARLGEALRG